MCEISNIAVLRPAAYRVCADDPAAFSTYSITALHHNFHEHPLFQIPELVKLGKELAPLDQCRFMRPGITVASPIAHDGRHPDGRSIDEFFHRLEEPSSSVALYNIEVVPRTRPCSTPSSTPCEEASSPSSPTSSE